MSGGGRGGREGVILSFYHIIILYWQLDQVLLFPGLLNTIGTLLDRSQVILQKVKKSQNMGGGKKDQSSPIGLLLMFDNKILSYSCNIQA